MASRNVWGVMRVIHSGASTHTHTHWHRTFWRYFTIKTVIIVSGVGTISVCISFWLQTFSFLFLTPPTTTTTITATNIIAFFFWHYFSGAGSTRTSPRQSQTDKQSRREHVRRFFYCFLLLNMKMFTVCSMCVDPGAFANPQLLLLCLN